MSVEEDLELFEGIKRVVREVNRLRLPLRRILLMVFLDSLGRFKFPKEPIVKMRFVRLIEAYSSSPYMDYVNLDQLQAKLRHVEGFSDLKRGIEAKISKRPDPSRICKPEEVDLRLEELRALDPSGTAEKQVEMALYTSLLWKSRNLGIHDAFRADVSWDDYREEKTVPYHSPCEEGKKEWVLCFPTAFIAKLLDDCVDNLKGEQSKSVNV